ncbi:hypothetical protein AltI4_29080 [Alteromonas sp. I4]|nr:hypothetical protein AltI4_29080 [Alteromonas sp. I4]
MNDVSLHDGDIIDFGKNGFGIKAEYRKKSKEKSGRQNACPKKWVSAQDRQSSDTQQA